MKHSHPRTFKLLSIIAKKNNILISFLNPDPSLDDLCMRLRVIFGEINKGQGRVEIDIPQSLDDSGNNVKRIYNCFSFWLPYCLEVYKKVGYSFSIRLNASDWQSRGFLSMVSDDGNNLIPDEYSMIESRRMNNFDLWSSYEQFRETWLQRENIMYWRGSSTGFTIDSISTLEQSIRVKACLSFKDVTGFDMKITNIVQNEVSEAIIRAWLTKKRILSRKVGEARFMNYKYYPDLPGNNQTCGSWGTIKKHLRGNLVFRPSHSSQLLYENLSSAWENYIPVKNDLSDLSEKYNWAILNEDQAARIAWNGFLLAREYLENIGCYFISSAITKIIKC